MVPWPKWRPSYNLLVRCDKAGQPYWEAKWRDGGQQLKRRLGVAWLVADGQGRWERRPGRPPADVMDERRAHAAAVQTIARVAMELAERERLERERATARDRARARARVAAVAGGRAQGQAGDAARLRRAAARTRDPVRARHARDPRPADGRSRRSPDQAAAPRATCRRSCARSTTRGSRARNVNKHRQVLASMFRYACREDTHGLPSNPVLARPTSAPSHRRRHWTTTRSRGRRRWPSHGRRRASPRRARRARPPRSTSRTPSSTGSCSSPGCGWGRP